MPLSSKNTDNIKSFNHKFDIPHQHRIFSLLTKVFRGIRIGNNTGKDSIRVYDQYSAAPFQAIQNIKYVTFFG